jgi:hypothetical protein
VWSTGEVWSAKDSRGMAAARIEGIETMIESRNTGGGIIISK